MKQIVLEVTYILPRSERESTKLFGPVFGQTQANWLMRQIMRKRNVVTVRTRLATKEEEV